MLIALLPGDGIGPEVVTQAKRVLDALGLEGLTYESALVGGAAYKAEGHPLPRSISRGAAMPSCSARWVIQTVMASRGICGPNKQSLGCVRSCRCLPICALPPFFPNWPRRRH